MSEKGLMLLHVSIRTYYFQRITENMLKMMNKYVKKWV